MDVTNTKKIVYKIIVIGDANVGKTSLTYRFCERKFLKTPETTIGVDFRQRVLNIDGEIITLQLWDTAGLERNRRSMIQHYYRNVDAVIFVYDVGNMKSFISLKYWIDECEKNTFNDALRVIIGNKCDENVVVDTNTAQKFADENNMPLFEMSAKLDTQNDNIDGIFLTLAHKLKHEKPMMKSKSSIRVAAISSGSANDSNSNCYC